MAKTCALPGSFANCCWLMSSTAALWVKRRVQAAGSWSRPISREARRSRCVPTQALERMAASTSRNGGVALPVLLRQIADGRRKVAPGRRGMGELGAERIRPAAKRQHGLVARPGAPPAAAGRNRRPARPAGRRTAPAAPLIWRQTASTRLKAPRRQHRDLIDDEHLGLLDAGGEAAVGRRAGRDRGG